MPKRYPVAEARSRLPRLLHEVERGSHVEITRRGEPVAVVVSVGEYRRLTAPSRGFAEAYAAWRQTVDPRDLALPEGWLEGLRDRSPGRPVRL